MAVTINGSTGLELEDNDKQIFGAGDDLQIYHDGSHSYLKNGTGQIAIDGDLIKFRSAGLENFLVATDEAGVELYFDDSKKFETTSTGVKVTTTLEATGNINPSADGGSNIGEASKRFYRGYFTHGIGLNGETSAGNMLDDYEEGTYNPSWGGVTNTNNYNDWVYRKVGGLVYVTGRFKCATTTNNGTTVHATVPFTPAGNPTNGYNTSVGTVMHKEVNTYNSGNFTSYLSTNTNLYFYKCQQNGDWDSLGSDDVAVNDEMIVSLTYMT